MVVGDKAADGVTYFLLERVEPIRFGRRRDQRVVLRADRVIRGRDAGAAIALEFSAIDIVEHRRA
jgi:hypothetical protein